MTDVIFAIRENSGKYDTAVVQDSLVRMTVRALSFLTNGNRFRHKKSVLQAVHENAFGEKIPAYKSFEGQLVNRNHSMRDNGKPTDEPIGYVETAHLRDDGVYLDLVLWKRCLTDNQLTQIREKSVKVSMELDYTDPVWILSDGSVVPAPKRKEGEKSHKVPPGTVRTMAENSVASFVGIAVLFDGIAPGDARAITLASENASLDEQDGQGGIFLEPLSDTETEMPDATKTTETAENPQEVIPEVIPEPAVEVIPETPAPEVAAEAVPEVAPAPEVATDQPLTEAEISALRTQLAEQVSAREQAEADLNALHSTKQELEAKLTENDQKFSEVMAEFTSLKAQMDEVREKSFNENMGANFNTEALSPEDRDWLLNYMRCHYFGATNPDVFMEIALRFCAIAACIVKSKGAKTTDASDSEQSATAPEADFSIAGKTPTQKQWTADHL